MRVEDRGGFGVVGVVGPVHHPGHVRAGERRGQQVAAQDLLGLAGPEVGAVDSRRSPAAAHQRPRPAVRDALVGAPRDRVPAQVRPDRAEQRRVEHRGRPDPLAQRAGQHDQLGLGRRDDRRAGCVEDDVGQELGLAAALRADHAEPARPRGEHRLRPGAPVPQPPAGAPGPRPPHQADPQPARHQPADLPSVVGDRPVGAGGAGRRGGAHPVLAGAAGEVVAVEPAVGAAQLAAERPGRVEVPPAVRQRPSDEQDREDVAGLRGRAERDRLRHQRHHVEHQAGQAEQRPDHDQRPVRDADLGIGPALAHQPLPPAPDQAPVSVKT